MSFINWHKKSKYAIPILLVLIVIVGVGVYLLSSYYLSPKVTSSGQTAAALSSQPTAASSGVSVNGNHLAQKGSPFIVKGVILQGLVAPDPLLSARQTQYREAFGSTLLQKARAWNVNTIRFNFSQAALDPQSSIYNDSNYLTEVQNAVALARSMGFVVIVSDQDEIVAHDPNPPPVRMPTAATLRADLTLTSFFKNDQGVIIDLFNEPSMSLSPTNWQLWLNGGTYKVNATTTETMVGFQTLINTLRAAGSKNVFLIGALNNTSFEGVPTTLTDPLNDYMYDPHLLDPSVFAGNTVADWQAHFGFLADEGKPVLLGAFNAAASDPLGSNTDSAWCKKDPSLDLPQTFLNFLAQKKIGVVGFGFDYPGTIVTDLDGTPSTYVGMSCGSPKGGSGEILQAQFKLPTPVF